LQSYLPPTGVYKQLVLVRGKSMSVAMCKKKATQQRRDSIPRPVLQFMEHNPEGAQDVKWVTFNLEVHQLDWRFFLLAPR
jgi:hypothetical protein